MSVVILAGGRGKRLSMLSSDGRSKPFIEILGKPMICHLLDSIPDDLAVIVVLSESGLEFWDRLVLPRLTRPIQIAIQSTPRGTGDALRSALPLCNTDKIIVVNADTPLLDMKRIVSHNPSRPIAMFVARRRGMSYSHGMGKCSLDPMTGTWYIHEACTLTEPPHDDDFVNAGVYIMNKEAIEAPLNDLIVHGDEYYLTDIVSVVPTEAIIIPENECHMFQGINTPEEYAHVLERMR